MAKRLNSARVCLSISSDVMSPDEIAAELALTPTQSFVKGTPTGERDVPLHPCHIAMFIPEAYADAGLEAQLEAALAMCEPIKHRLVKLSATCGVSIFCDYWMEADGGWTISPDLSRRIGALPLHYVFNVERKKPKRKKHIK
jgi:Domain of unknown function (DUF4279)